MLSVGLTGGIGAGKSTVLSLLASHGAKGVSADVLAREVVESGTPGLRQIVEHFGSEVLDSNGQLDRAEMAGLIFSSPSHRLALEAIIHPLVRHEIEAVLNAHMGTASIVVVEVPLLVETGVDSYNFDVVISIEASPDVAVERVVSARGMDKADAQSRIAHQVASSKRHAIADFILENNGDYAELAVQVDELWITLEGLAAEREISSHP